MGVKNRLTPILMYNAILPIENQGLHIRRGASLTFTPVLMYNSRLYSTFKESGMRFGHPFFPLEPFT